MLDKVIEQAFTQVGLSIASDIASNPQGAIQGLNQFMDSLCPHHTAEDVAQDALDAFEAGNLSHKACLAIVQIVVADVEQTRVQRSPQPSPRPATPSLALKQQTAMEVRSMIRALS